MTTIHSQRAHTFTAGVTVAACVLAIAATVGAVRASDPGWQVETTKLTPTDSAPAQRFGRATAASDDRILVGAPEDAENGTGAGAAYVYEFGGGAWSQQAKLLPANPNEFQRFGCSVALDGDIAVIGVPHDDEVHFDAGAAYVFSYDGAQWVQDAKLMASDGTYQDQFGTSVAVRGGVIAVGAPLADRDTDYPYPNTGAAYVFRHDDVTWIEEAKLVRPINPDHASPGAELGAAVSIDDDVIVAGARGDREDIPGDPVSGSLSVFRYDGMVWTEEARLLPSDGESSDRFGSAVAISGDLIAVGAPRDDIEDPNTLVVTKDAGSVYVFRHDGVEWLEETKLVSPTLGGADLLDDDYFGGAVALDGDTLLIGSRYDDDWGLDVGAAYAYHHDGIAWSEQFKFVPTWIGYRDAFGVSVALSGSHFVIGAVGDDSNSELAGAAYVFEFENDCNHNAIPDEDDIIAGTSADLNNNGVPDECEPPPPGDVNCDIAVNNGDIDAFVLALTDYATYLTEYPGCDNADVNGDGWVNNGDIDAFVTLLTSQQSLPGSK